MMTLFITLLENVKNVHATAKGDPNSSFKGPERGVKLVVVLEGASLFLPELPREGAMSCYGCCRNSPREDKRQKHEEEMTTIYGELVMVFSVSAPRRSTILYSRTFTNNWSSASETAEFVSQGI
jgi:hypothetical protein